MLTPRLLADLRSPAGAELLARAESLIDDPFAVEKLRKSSPPDLAVAAVDQVRLRRRAVGKFARASEMWFSPSLLEQSSGDEIARHRAARFSGLGDAPVGDFCCGLGGDAVELAAEHVVLAVDRDPLALALTAANAAAAGCPYPVRLVETDLPGGAPRVPSAWVDPGRREATGSGGNRRTRKLASISPTLAECLSLRERTPEMGIKLSPASDDAELDAHLGTSGHEREWISVRGECRELVVWLGRLAGEPAGRAHRATLLPGGAALSGEPVPYGEVCPVREWLLEPDAAVIRAGLVGNLAEQIGAGPVDSRLAYLTSDRDVETPFARSYRVDAVLPFSARELGAELRRRQAGDVVLKTRGSAVAPEGLRQQLRGVLKQGRPDSVPVVFLTRLAGRPTMIVGERFGSGSLERR